MFKASFISIVEYVLWKRNNNTKYDYTTNIHIPLSFFRPVVRHIPNLGKFHEAKSEHIGGVFFMFVGALDVGSLLLVSI